MGGWVRMYRDLLDHPVWMGERFSKGQAWVDLILSASYSPNISLKGNVPVQVERGQVLTSAVKLASRWMWNVKSVRRFLAVLKVSLMVDIRTSKHSETGYTIITICNYDKYQTTEPVENETVVSSQRDIGWDIRGTSGGHPGDTIKKVRSKEGKKEQIHREAPASQNGHKERSILDWLNLKASRSYRPVETNLDLIRARLKDGILDWQLKAIVSIKVEAWKGTDMDKYLRPATLFNRTKCEQYLGELPKEDTNGVPTLRPGSAGGIDNVPVRVAGTETSH